MTTWERLNATRFCGGCGATIDRDAPVLVIAVEGLSRRLVRGQCCAGECPIELPHLPDPSARPEGVVKELPLTFQLAAATHRAPRISEWMPYKESE